MPRTLEQVRIPSQEPHETSALPLARGRFTIYAAFAAAVLIGLVVILILFLCVWEMKLEADHIREWEEKSKQVRPYYTWQFVTHDGLTVSHQHKGPLKLALHPFAIYSNLPDHHTPYFRINGMGFRGKDNELIHGPKKRIVLVGGSTAFGTGLDGDRETFGSQLEDLLDVEVINGAVIGHSSGQELAYLLMNLVDLQPDLVLTLDGWNDYSKRKELTDPRLLGTNGFEQFENRLRTLAEEKHASLLRRAAYVPRLLFPRVSARLKQSKLGLWTGMRKPEAEQWLPLEAAAEMYAANIIKMSKLSAAFKYTFLCVIQPEVGNQADYRLFRDIVKAGLWKNQVPFLDLGETEQIKDDMFFDTIHPNAAGHRIMAEIVARRITHDNLLSGVQAGAHSTKDPTPDPADGVHATSRIH